MERQTEVGVQLQREEPERAVASPLHPHDLSAALDFGLDQRSSLAFDSNDEARSCEGCSVCFPTPDQRCIGVVKQMDVARHPRRGQQLVERDIAGDVTLAGVDSVAR
jgi:hypothetical protein